MKISNSKLLPTYLFFLLIWSFRLFKINETIANGFLLDFKDYYLAAHELLSVNPNIGLIANTTFGPPFVLLPYLPFSLLPFKEAEYLITILNLISWFVVFYRLWKKFVNVAPAYLWRDRSLPLFWFLLSSSAFSFPLIFSLGMGNPVGFVTLGIYGFFIFENTIMQILVFSLSWTLKIFPIITIIPQLFVGTYRGVHLRKLLLSVFVIAILSLLFLPFNSWSKYFNFAQTLSSQTIIPDPIIYNQSLSSTFARLGIFLPSFSIGHIIFALLLLALLAKKYQKLKPLDATIALISLTLLIHPFPWQYYFAIFLPYIFIKIGQRDYKYFFIYFLMSLNWESSQFFATLLLFLFIIFHNRDRLRPVPTI